jgi:hypothetical protein
MIAIALCLLVVLCISSQILFQSFYGYFLHFYTFGQIWLQSFYGYFLHHLLLSILFLKTFELKLNLSRKH